jgi:hypothetical protein
MKRTLVVLLALVISLPAFAFNTRRGGNRIGVVDSLVRGEDGQWQPAVSSMQRFLRAELHRLGFEAFETRCTFDELAENEGADYYVEILSDQSTEESLGGIGIGNRRVGVEAEVTVARVAARVRVYDSALREVGTFDLRRSNTTFLPTSIGGGSHNVALWIALPFVREARYRSVLRAVAKDAAVRVADAARN